MWRFFTRNGHRFLGTDGSLASAMAQLEPDVSFKGLFEMEMMYLYINNIMCIYIICIHYIMYLYIMYIICIHILDVCI